MKNNKMVIISLFLVLVFLVTVSCAPGNTRFVEKAAGFWSGLWHGLICGITFIISLFTDKVNMFEVNNTGNWYNFGFLIGVMIIFSGGSGSSKYKKRKKGRVLKFKISDSRLKVVAGIVFNPEPLNLP